jgi:hypothetical protein
MEQVKKGNISVEELKNIDELLSFFEDKYKDAEAKHGGILIKPEYKTKRIIKNL